MLGPRFALKNSDARSIRIDEMRQSLEELARSCHGDERHDCPILTDLAQDG